MIFYPTAKAEQWKNSYYTDNHYFTIGGGVGYSTLLTHIPSLKTSGNVGGNINLGYELRTNGFWMNIGAELQYLSSSSIFEISGIDKMIYDTQGKQALMHYDFERPTFSEKSVFVNVPITLGYYYNGLFLGAGAKIGYCLLATESARMAYSTSASYQQYIDDFSSMQDHFYTTHSSSTKENIGAKYKISIIAEIGYDVLSHTRQANHTYRNGLRIGVFAEYGLNNIITTTSTSPLYTFTNTDASKINIHPLYNTIYAQSYKTYPLYVGARVILILNIQTEHCPWCNTIDRHRNYKKRYGRIQH